jgi:hypothetical protein
MAAARIVYLSWPAGEISGGIKAAFQHVEMLVDAGLQAVVATADGLPPGWFESTAQVVALDQVAEGDVLVFPENNLPLLERFAAWPARKLVFCQNPYFVPDGLRGRASYAEFGVTGLLCPSHTVVRYCRQRFPQLPAAYTPYFIDHQRFACPDSKTLQIACMPRKRGLELRFIHDLFRAAHPQFAGIEWLVLQDATERQVADTLGRSAVYLSLARLEAHAMTVLEAMACGCLVAGFSGVAGGSDSATAANGLWAAEDDLIACTDRLAQAVQWALEQGPAYQGLVASARRTALGWRREESAALLLAFWGRWLGG